MVHRESVTDDLGRQWVSGSLDSDTYFAEVRRRARERAERVLADQIERENGRHADGSDGVGRRS